MNRSDNADAWLVGVVLAASALLVLWMLGVPASAPLDLPATGEPVLESLTPDGGDTWTVDDAGVRSTVKRVAKIPGKTLQTGPTTLRLLPDSQFHLLGQDSRHFYVRVEEMEHVPARPLPNEEAEALPSVEASAAATPWFLKEVDVGLPRSGQWRNGFALADMDGDGRLDVVHGPARKGNREPHIWRNDGTGHFLPWQAVQFPDAPYDYGDVAVADFDGDGRQDLALGIHLGGVLVLAQVAPGRFELRTQGLPAPSSHAAAFSSRAVAAGDWDGDGRMDLLALSDGPRPPSGATVGAAELGLHIFLSKGTTFELLPTLSDRAFGDALEVMDLDGDGRADAVVGSARVDDVEVLRQSTVTGPKSKTLHLPGPRTLVQAVAASAGKSGPKVVLGALRQGLQGWEPVLVMVEDPLHAEKTLVMPLRSPALAVAVVDVDGDAQEDVLAALEDGSVLAWRWEGQGMERVLETRFPAWALGCRPWKLAVAALGKDSTKTLLVSLAGEGGPGCRSGGGMAAWTVAVR